MRFTLICDDRDYDEEDDLGLVPLQRTFDLEAGDLRTLAMGLAEAIRGCGFNYVDKVVFVKDSGDETSSDDIIDESIINVEDLLKSFTPEKKVTKFRVIDNGKEETKDKPDK